ncbi:acetone carboxylase subunit gamma [Fictibacillus enclensis]|uniref:acetone carboxylase subunit gamma n=1 Tax=Fictibacillus enclensis TaxID=1017270 RepID=UPI00333B3C1A
MITEYLQITDGSKQQIQCSKCSHILCSAKENYKLHAIMKEDSIKEANPQNFESRQYVDRDMVFRKYYCPKCAVQLETEVNVRGEKPIWDINIKIGQ